MREDVLKEFIEILEEPNCLTKEKRFKLLEKCYLLKNNAIDSSSKYIKKIDAIHAIQEVDRLHRIKHTGLSSDTEINMFITKFSG